MPGHNQPIPGQSNFRNLPQTPSYQPGIQQQQFQGQPPRSPPQQNTSMAYGVPPGVMPQGVMPQAITPQGQMPFPAPGAYVPLPFPSYSSQYMDLTREGM
jgi:hypothetical protein